jgi:hypothetical protein
MIHLRVRHRGDDVDFSDSVSGAQQAEAHRQFLQFLRGLRELDAALGRWRPDYGRLPAAAAPDPAPTTEAAVIEAHRRYADGLRFLADHPEATQALGQPAADDVAAALADAHVRFGAPAAPLEWFVPGAAPPAPPPPAAPPPVAGEGEVRVAGGTWAGAKVPPGAGRIAQSPWEVERPTDARSGERNPPAPRRPPASGRQEQTEVAPPPRAFGRGFAIGMSLAAVAIIVILGVGLWLGARAVFGPGPTASPTASVAPATLPASDLPTGTPADVLAPAAACTALPTGQVPAALALSSAASGLGSDPDASGYTNPDVSVHLAGTVGSATPALSLIVAVLPYQATAPTTGVPVNRAGTLQLIAYWDGSRWHGALRSWSGSAWTLPTGAGSQVDVVQTGTVVTLFWQGLVTGDKYGVIVTTGTGCADLAMSSTLAPTDTYGTEATS